ncbi:hypothetical protein [Flavobacterium adhaerens]|uniref:hypothetical protein n=1 Tax=Flavobacterium adhaerens TaxID=3149043 RepID=UPI0032B36EB7
MERNPEIIRNKINQIKIELEQKTLNYKSNNSDTEMILQYSCIFEQITYRGRILDDELIKEINQAIVQAKSKFGEGYAKSLNEMGIRL